MAETNATYYDFIKSGLYKAGPDGGTINKGYQDPTYLSFVLMFVPGSDNKNPNGLTSEFESPLFSQEAEDFYTKLTNAEDTKKYAEKLQAFQDFKTALFKINNEMPWYWQSLAGVDRFLQFDPLRPYWGGDEAKLTITCLETINLAITGLMNLYRKAVFDEEKWAYVLPANLRKFSMWVYVKDMRRIESWNDVTDTPLNVDIAGMGMSFLLTFCEFDIASGSKSISELSNIDYTMAAQEISIKYERMNRVDGQYLAGVINDTTDKVKQNDVNVPPVNQTSNKYPNDPFNLNKTVDSYKQKFSKDGINEQFKTSQNIAKDQLINLGNKKKEEILGAITSTINDKIPSINNIIMNGVNKIDQASNVNGLLSPIAVEETVKANVYGLKVGQSISDALNAAAVLSLGNVYK